MDLGLYNSYMEIDMSRIKDAFDKTAERIGPNCKIMPVIKANAYAHGLEEISRFYVDSCKAEILACAQVYEGERLRHAGIKVPVLVMGGLPFHTVPYAVSNDLHVTVFEGKTLELLQSEASKQGRRVKAHIKIETGLHRIGVLPGEDLNRLLDYIETLNNIDIVGVYTHFSTATTAFDPFAIEQHRRFCAALEQVRARGIEPEYVHACNTGAASWFDEAYFSHVRVGALLLGYPSMDDFSNPLDVSECASFKGFITCISSLNPGESAGYNRHFTAQSPMRIAAVSLGYADGLYRPLAQEHGPVLVGDSRTRYLSTAMDQTIVDVTGIDCDIGDEVTVFGRSKGGTELRITELEEITGQTLAYLISAISPRVKRVYKY